MPRIKEYTSQESAPGPVNVNINANQFGAQAYQGLANLGSGIEDAGTFLEKRATQSEVPGLHAQLSGLANKHTKGLTDALKNTDPSDTKAVQSITENFENQYDADIDKIRQSIQTPGARNFFERASESLKSKLLESAIHVQSELAGSNNLLVNEKAVNDFSSSIQSNPSQFDAFKQQYEQQIDGLVQHGGLPVSTAQEMKQKASNKFAESSVLGWASLGAGGIQEARDQLKSGKYDDDVNGIQKTELFGKIDHQETINRIKNDQILKQQQDALATAQIQTQNDFIHKLVKGELDPNDIDKSNLSPVGSGSKKEFLDMAAKQNADGVNHTDPAIFRHVYDLVTRPDGDPQKMTDENALAPYVIRGEIGAQTVDSVLRPLIQNRRTQEGKDDAKFQDGVMKMAQSVLDPKSNAVTGISDPDGKARMQAFTTWFLPEWEKQRKAGVPAVKLADPRAQESLAKAIFSFTGSDKDKMDSVLRHMKGQASGWNLPDNPGTQYGPAPVADPVPAGAPPVPPAAPKESRVEVIGPDGRHYDVPQSQLDEAIKRGYKKAQ